MNLQEIALADWTAEWRERFRSERARLERAIGGDVLRIEHIGSTSVEGLAAKPVVDIGIAVASFERAARCVEPLVALGYEYKGEYGIPRRHYFNDGLPRRCQIHMLEETSREWRNHLSFRDALRRHPALADEYAALKRELARRFSPDIEAYADAKGDFVQSALESARAEGVPEVVLRDEHPADREAVFDVNERAFGRPDEARLVDRLREHGALLVSLVAVEAGHLLGHVAFSAVSIRGPGTESRAIGLAPLAVEPERQTRGVGARLARAGLERCRALGQHVVVVLGNPAYYGRFGFRRASERGLHYAGEAPEPAFQAIELEPGALAGRTGQVHYAPEFAATE